MASVGSPDRCLFRTHVLYFLHETTRHRDGGEPVVAAIREDEDDPDMNQQRCPEWWPLPDNTPIGEERAAELVEYIRSRATPIIDIANAYLKQRNPGQEIRVRSSRVGAIAKLALEPHMTGIPIGTVSAGIGGNAHIVRIGFDRAGRVTASLSKPSEPVMRSVSM